MNLPIARFLAPAQALEGWLEACGEIGARWRHSRKARRDHRLLSHASDGLLRDIGLNRCDLYGAGWERHDSTRGR